ncbi:hypothetical protein [Nonomuraea fuscirosea]|uniref:hypothetical protein n=1 Tax=Nonomuraea fuscirosea TaxID=1291556 RepID=UPI0034154351
MPLAMGAARVIAPSRGERAPAALERRFGERAGTVRLTGEADRHRERMIAATGGAPGPRARPPPAPGRDGPRAGRRDDRA